MKGIFTILLPHDADYKVLGYYFSDKRIEFKVTSDLFLRLNLDHSKNEFSLLNLKNYTIASYLHNFKGKLARKASGIIIGLLLDEDDKPEKFQASLKKSAETINTLNILEMSQDEFESSLKEIYDEHIETMLDMLDAGTIKESIINRTKELLSGGKRERKLATDLLQKIEANLHTKIPENYKLAEKALKSEDYDKAGKFFENAAKVAEELLDIELAKTLREKAENSRKIPISSKGLEKKVQQARNYLRNEQFNVAYVAYKRASEIAKELMLSDEEEEYRLKSKALQDFYQVDQKFKKKK